MPRTAGLIVTMCVLLCVGAPAPASTAGADAARQLFGIDDHGTITDGVVTALSQDRVGYLWIGTPDGLLRYDGYRFHRFAHVADDPSSLGGNFVRSLLVDRDGRLWIGTEADGLSVYDPRTDRFTRFSHNPDDPHSLPNGSVRALAEDADGRIWVGTIGGGLSWMQPATAHFTPVEIPARDGTGVETRVSSLLAGSSGSLWIGTWNGLARLNADGTAPHWIEFAKGDVIDTHGTNIQTLFQARDGRVWAGTTNNDVVVFDALLEKPLHRFHMDADVTAINQVGPDRIWVGHGAGIDIYDAAATRHVESLRHLPGDPDSLTAAQVSAIWTDTAGWVWIGSAGGGLQRTYAHGSAFTLRRMNTRGATADAAFNITSVLELDNGQIWLGTASQGVIAFDRRFRLLRMVLLDVHAEATHRVYVGALAQTPDHLVWAGSPDGLHVLRPDGTPLRTYSSREWLDNARIRRLLATADGGLWIGTSDGLFHLPTPDGEIVRLPREDGGGLHVSINALVADAEHNVWIGSAQGLYVAPAEQGGAVREVLAPDDAAPAHRSVLGMLIDRHQRLLVDTPEGLHAISEWDGTHARFDRISERLDIGGQSVGANLLEDERGRIWTHKMVIDEVHQQSYALTPADGFDLGTGWFRSYTQTRDGRLLYGGSKGLLVVQPRRFRTWSYTPTLIASDLRVDGQTRPTATLERTGLTLQPGERGFSVEFSALDFSAPALNRYAYQLENFDSNWIMTDASRRIASYSNLWPGNYLLKVRGSNRAGIWSPHELRVPIRILPVWWQTWWFTTLGLLALMLSVLALIRARTAQLARARSALEESVRQRTHALEQVSKELEEKSAALELASLTDPLTGLRNRRFLSQQLVADVALCLRQQSTEGVADMLFFLIDIDHFKQVNDLHGHAAGDAVLVEVANRLLTVFRESDYVVRWGGEEFLAVARSTSRGGAVQLAERIRRSIAEREFILPDGGQIHRTCSIGFTAFPFVTANPRSADWERTVELADLAMYAAKGAGRNAWVGLAASEALTEQEFAAGSRRLLIAEIAHGRITVLSNLPPERIVIEASA